MDAPRVSPRSAVPLSWALCVCVLLVSSAGATSVGQAALAMALQLVGLIFFQQHRVLRWRRVSSTCLGALMAGGVALVSGQVVFAVSGLSNPWPCWCLPVLAPAVAPLMAQLLRWVPPREISVSGPSCIRVQAARAASATIWPRFRVSQGADLVGNLEGDFMDARCVLRGEGWMLPLYPEGPAEGCGHSIKRAIDLCLLCVALPLAVPVAAVLCLVISCLGGKGPVFYSQTRVTEGERVFRIHKFRSMVLDAEPGGVAVWPEEGDPRITPLGRTLRRFWLDELPQLWDVLVGNMSLVGPRPERPAFVQAFSRDLPKYPLRHLVKGGMTGLAQVNGLVGNTPISRRLRHDLAYARLWSPCLDLWILTATMFRALRRPRIPSAT